MSENIVSYSVTQCSLFRGMDEDVLMQYGKEVRQLKLVVEAHHKVLYPFHSLKYSNIEAEL